MRSIVLLLALLVAGCDREKDAGSQANPAEAAAQGGLDRSHRGSPLPDVTIRDPDGEAMEMAAFAGVPTLVNLWATWCAPCVKELPTLDALAARHATDGQLGVVTVSQDMGPQPSVAAFLAKLKVAHLGAYHDPDMALTSALGVTIMPTTILYGRDGKEIWRFVGDLDWTGPEAARLLAEASPAKAR